MNQKQFENMEIIISKNLEQRGIKNIDRNGELENASRELLNSSTVVIVTGFVVRACMVGETDGPIGAISLAFALEELGKEVIIVTDKFTEDILREGCLFKNVKAKIEIVTHGNILKLTNKIIDQYKPSHIVAIERPGRSRDGKCYSMRGEDLTDLVPNTDELFIEAKRQGIVTIAIGDGGNEVGMGNIEHLIVDSVTNGSKISAVVSVDYLILAGVSNWGGHALVAGLSLLSDNNLLHERKIETKLLEKIVHAGAVDGCTLEKSITVDGLSLEENLLIVDKLREEIIMGIY